MPDFANWIGDIRLSYCGSGPYQTIQRVSADLITMMFSRRITKFYQVLL